MLCGLQDARSVRIIETFRSKETAMAQEPLEVHKVTFEVYKVTIENTNKLRDQKQALDTLYTTITTFVLGAAAYTASHSKFNSWFPVIVTIIISLVVLAFTLH